MKITAANFDERKKLLGANFITVNLEVKDGKLYLPIQSDVENVALKVVDDSDQDYIGDYSQIYFDTIPLTDRLYLEYDGYGWEIKIREGIK